MTEKKKKEEAVCFFKCGEPMIGEHYSFIRNDKVERAHSKCHRLDQQGKQTIKFQVK